MSACAEEMITSALTRPVTGSTSVMCSALTVISAVLFFSDQICSLRTIVPPGMLRVWFGCAARSRKNLCG